MPFYEYECENCKFYLETMQKITDTPIKKCPSCGKSALKKLISAPNFRLKGAGWYETDFKSDGENKRNLAGAEKEEAKPAAEASASDAKPAETKATESKPSESKPAASTKRKPAKAPARKPVKAAARTSRAPAKPVKKAAKKKARRR